MTTHRVAGALLVVSAVIVTISASMFAARSRRSATLANFSYEWERVLSMVAAVVAAAGFFLLLWTVSGSTNPLVARLGVSAFVVAVLFLVVAEILGLSRGGSRRPLIVTYVVFACLAQAAIGGALVVTGFVPSWIGWATIAWNVVGLAVLVMVTPEDVYFPFFHHVMPLVIGVPLLWRG